MLASVIPDDRQSSNGTITHGNKLLVIVSATSHRHRGHRVTRLNDQRPVRRQQRQSSLHSLAVCSWASPVLDGDRVAVIVSCRQSSARYATLALRRIRSRSVFPLSCLPEEYYSRDIAQSRSVHIASHQGTGRGERNRRKRQVKGYHITARPPRKHDNGGEVQRRRECDQESAEKW